MAEVSLYPLGTRSLSGPIRAFLHILESQKDLEVIPGNMSTQVSGEISLVFSSLEQAFSSVMDSNDCVMTLKVSNACPAEFDPQKEM